MPSLSKTILLIHGLWVTPLCWQPSQRHYKAKGYRVLAPSWPGVRQDVEDLRNNPESLHGVGAGEVIDHFVRIIRSLMPALTALARPWLQPVEPLRP
jgi:pimeloyl-ACP methyl ester carboxylesterase